jgi:N-acetylmuramic acid 6-phosphate (MurNAc-6-P) etherase
LQAQDVVLPLRKDYFQGKIVVIDRITAARTGQGFIKLQKETAGQVTQAIEQVSRIIEQSDDGLLFEGRRIVAGHGFALRINCYDVYECPGGFLLHTYLDKGSNWVVSATTVEAMLAAAPDRQVARRAYGELIKNGLGQSH